MKKNFPFQIISTLAFLLLACGETHETENTITAGETHDTENVLTVSQIQNSEGLVSSQSDALDGNLRIKMRPSNFSPLKNNETYIDTIIDQDELTYPSPEEDYWVEIKQDFEDQEDSSRVSQIYWAFLKAKEKLPEQIILEEAANVIASLPDWPEFTITGFGALGTDHYTTESFIYRDTIRFRLEDVAPGDRSFYFVAKVNDPTQRDTLLHIGPFEIISSPIINYLSRPDMPQ